MKARDGARGRGLLPCPGKGGGGGCRQFMCLRESKTAENSRRLRIMVSNGIPGRGPAVERNAESTNPCGLPRGVFGGGSLPCGQSTRML